MASKVTLGVANSEPEKGNYGEAPVGDFIEQARKWYVFLLSRSMR